jgi:hypothetical protein
MTPQQLDTIQNEIPEHYVLRATWTYKNAEEAVIGYVARYDLVNKKDGLKEKDYRPFFRRSGDVFLVGAALAPRPLYGLDVLAKRPDAPVLIVEGEKTADAAAVLFPGFVVVTSSGGNCGAGSADWTPLVGRASVTIWPDNDKAGFEYAKRIAKLLPGAGVVSLPESLCPKWDVADELPSELTPADLLRLIEKAPVSDTKAKAGENVLKFPGGQKNKRLFESLTKAIPGFADLPGVSETLAGSGASQADILLEVVKDADLFHADDDATFADVKVDGHREIYRVPSAQFRSWLTHCYYRKEKRGPGGTALETALNTIVAKARFEGPQRPVYRRVASHDKRIYIDLCDALWRVIEIDRKGWRIVEDPPVRFIRSASALPLPVPERGGDINELKAFLNVRDRDSFILAASYIMAGLRPSGPYPILVLTGREGSAKSTFARIVRGLIDPNRAPIRALPREEADLFISANNSHMLAYDNVSSLADWQSDALCRISTGGAYAKRALYKDSDETIIDACQPISLNGIEDFVAKPDLADRSIFMPLEFLENFTPEEAFWAGFERARPKILGVLLDAMSHGLRELPNLRLDWYPRLADFAIWGTACGGAVWEAGGFLRAYKRNRNQAAETVLDANLVGSAVMKFMEGKDAWEGTATDLLAQLNKLVSEREQKEKGWPKRANRLSNLLRTVAGTLAKVGTDVKFWPGRTSRLITIKTNSLRKTSSPSSTSSHHNKVNGLVGDGASPDDHNIVTGGDPADDLGNGRDDGWDKPQQTNQLKTNGNDDGGDGDDVLQNGLVFPDDGDQFAALKDD